MSSHTLRLVAALFWCGVIAVEWRRGYFSEFPKFLRRCGREIPFLALAISLAAAAAVVPFDLPLRAAVQGIRNPWVIRWIRVGGFWGQGTALWFTLMGIYAAAWLARRAPLKEAAFGCVASASIASIFSTLLKAAVARARPNTGLDPFNFFCWREIFSRHSLFQSFPSGDVILVAAVAWYLVFRLQKVHPAARAALLLLPVATAFSRVFVNRHWPSDTLFSLGLAWASARWLVRYEAFSRDLFRGPQRADNG